LFDEHDSFIIGHKDIYELVQSIAGKPGHERVRIRIFDDVLTLSRNLDPEKSCYVIDVRTRNNIVVIDSIELIESPNFHEYYRFFSI
jgi:hypothetical protein